MAEILVLGLDCGGTHTDAALLLVDEATRSARLLASAKTQTCHDDLTASINEVMRKLGGMDNAQWLTKVKRVTLGTTLLINSVVENKMDLTGLAVTAGPGLNPEHFVLGEYYCVVSGGLDHRGKEVKPLQLERLKKEIPKWMAAGVKAIACVGKFSPRDPSHELLLADVCGAARVPITLGHSLSGRLNFPRRIATTYYNAAVGRMQNKFLDAVENTFAAIGLQAPARLLKADGGAIPFALARKEPVHSILSGPAASVMGMLAIGMEEADCTLCLDIGGTTTDIALIYKDSPIIDRDGMMIKDRHTLVNSLASVSIGLGGDSLIGWRENESGKKIITIGPDRIGPAMAFGGKKPTLLDALNVLDRIPDNSPRGNGSESLAGLEELKKESGIAIEEIANMAVSHALHKIVKACDNLVENINSKPIYTLAGLKNISTARPTQVIIAGGPANAIAARLKEVLTLPVMVCSHSEIANAIGAALALPTASLEIYVDGANCLLTAPALDIREKVRASFTLEDAERRACELLADYLQKNSSENVDIEVIEKDLFAVLDDRGRGSRDIRVASQARPGLCARLLA